MIREFDGEYRFLSNFHPSEIEVEGIVYPTVEHAFAAFKTANIDERKMIASLDTPGKAKRAGRQVTLRPDWESIKIGVMRRLVLEKFTRHEDLKAKLIETDDRALQEGNNWGDKFWGIDLATGVGENWLGKILMDLRSELIGKR